MAQNITLLGASYSAVPAVKLPKTGGGMAQFDDTTDADATADKIESGYTAYVNGVKLVGTGTGGGGSVTQDQDGFIILPATGGGGGSSVSGLEYETGTWSPSEDINLPTISFTNTHTSPPIIINMFDASSPFTPSVMSIVFWQYQDTWALTGDGFPAGSSSVSYALMSQMHMSTSGTTGGSRTTFSYNSSETGSTYQYPSYFVTASSFKPYTGSSSRYYISGRTYKWIAVWAPTT